MLAYKNDDIFDNYNITINALETKCYETMNTRAHAHTVTNTSFVY